MKFWFHESSCNATDRVLFIHIAIAWFQVEIKSLGDKILNKPLHEITAADGAGVAGSTSTPSTSSNGGGALFTKELEEALLAGRVDALVNCVKDMETTQPNGLTLSAITERGEPSDALVLASRHS